jgi:gluconolactonase
MGQDDDVGSGAARLIDRDARLVRLATGATWSEGPVWLPAARRVRWSDIPGDRILEFCLVTGSLSVYASGVEFTNGRTLDLDGHVVQCSHGRRRVERDIDGTVTEVVASYGGVRLNSPNDVVVALDGSIWFTDPAYGITSTEEGHPGVEEYDDRFVFRHDERTGTTVAVVTDVEDPNGLAFSPDESLLYVSDTSLASRPGGNHHIRVYDVVDGARCKNGRLFATVGPGVPDGFRVDERGNVWTSALDGVHVLAPDGGEVAFIPVPEKVGNLCFGGDDGRYLFVAATTSLYGIPTAVRDAAAVARGRAAGTSHDRGRRAASGRVDR